MTRRVPALGAVCLVLLTACAAPTPSPTPTPDPAAVPTGSPVPAGDEATGPITELGSGQFDGLGWRMLVYPAADGWCTQFETGLATVAGCGDPTPPEGGAFAFTLMGALGSSGLTGVDGIVGPDVATVWLIENDSQARVPAELWPLDDLGIEGQAFAGFAPAEMTVTHLQAVAFNGQVLETYELP